MSPPLRRPDRAALREDQRRLRERLRAQLEERKRDPRIAALLEKKRLRQRRRRIAAALVSVLLFLLLLRCECEEPVALEPLVEEPPVEVLAPAAPPTPTKRRPPRAPLAGKIAPSERTRLEVDATRPPPWLSQFRLQVAARSPRLATCFNGVEKPGALRWTALVHARSGRVSEPVLEPAFRGGELETSQVECLVRGLSNPPYNLDAGDDEAEARRVSLIFEF